MKVFSGRKAIRFAICLVSFPVAIYNIPVLEAEELFTGCDVCGREIKWISVGRNNYNLETIKVGNTGHHHDWYDAQMGNQWLISWRQKNRIVRFQFVKGYTTK